ncbi:HAD family hydrolase [Amycolatopsis silviterrae]|uniref:HAD family hydrolase n=1 Tax=Amycolatopsis silviterrae TaxID=1656914 RepID=A0ABW5HHM3_9PSEU
MRLVLFDLDTTLVDRAEGFRRWVWEFCAEHRLAEADAAWLIAADERGRADRATFFKSLRERFDLRETEPGLEDAYRERHPALVPAAPGVLTGLPRLRAAGWRIGVLGEGEPQLSTLLCTGIAGLVDGWALAGPDGLSTSDPKLLELAAERCETTLDGGWLVGTDVETGRSAGLRTVRIGPGRDHAVPDTAAAIALLLGS